MNQEEKTVKCSEAQRRANKKYRENNKEKVNIQRKKYYQERKERDPDFMEYKRVKARQYYRLKQDRLYREADLYIALEKKIDETLKKLNSNIENKE